MNPIEMIFKLITSLFRIVWAIVQATGGLVTGNSSKKKKEKEDQDQEK